MKKMSASELDRRLRKLEKKYPVAAKRIAKRYESGMDRFVSNLEKAIEKAERVYKNKKK